MSKELELRTELRADLAVIRFDLNELLEQTRAAREKRRPMQIGTNTRIKGALNSLERAAGEIADALADVDTSIARLEQDGVIEDETATPPA